MVYTFTLILRSLKRQLLNNGNCRLRTPQLSNSLTTGQLVTYKWCIQKITKHDSYHTWCLFLFGFCFTVIFCLCYWRVARQPQKNSCHITLPTALERPPLEQLLSSVTVTFLCTQAGHSGEVSLHLIFLF